MSVSGPTAVTSANPLPNQNKEGNAWHEFDILAAVVSRYQNAAPKKPQSPEHRISCHRCGNIRKRRILCTRSTCPHTFCGRCAEKMKEEHGLDVFFGGCPVCKELCCCNNKSVFCHRKNHCYRKCPATKTNGKHANTTVKDDSDSEPYQEEVHSIPKPENGQYGIFDLLAAVADMDKANPTLCRPAKSMPGGVASGAPPRKKPKQGKDGVGMGAGKSGYPNNMLLGEPSAYAPYFSGSSSLPDAASSLQMLHQKSPSSSSTSQGMPMGLSGDSGVDGYTFNNNTMGIIPGGINGVDAITLMGQQKQRFPNAMEKLNMSMANDPLLSSINTSAASSSSASSATTLSHSAAATAAATNNLGGIFGRLPSIDSNPFSTSSAKDANRTTPTFDQALLDSVRNIQADPYHMAMGRPLPSVPRSAATSAAGSGFSPGIAAAGAGADRPAVAAPAAAEPTKLAVDPKAVSAASLEPMNLLALVSSFTQSLDKSTHLLPAEHLFLGTTAAAAAAAAQEASKAAKTEDSK